MERTIRILRSFGLIFLMAVVACVLCTAQAHAAPSKNIVKKANKAYNKYVSKKNIQESARVDIDKNGICELLYRDSKWKVGVCTYSAKQKKVVKIKALDVGSAGPVIYYNKKQHSFFLIHADTGGYEAYAIKLKGTKKKILRKMVYKNRKKYNNGVSFKINGKKYSRKKFLKILNKYYRWNSVTLY